MSGLEKLFSGMRAASSGLTAERARIDVITDNIANARTTRTPEGGPYRRKLVRFEPILERLASGFKRVVGVRASKVEEDFATPFERIYDPSHPDADGEGMVSIPNVNTVMEMADLISAMRAYDANVTAQRNFVRMAERSLDIAR